MSLQKLANRLRTHGNDLCPATRTCLASPSSSFAGLSRRNASPQPLETEEPLRRAAAKNPTQLLPAERSRPLATPWERFLYLLYKVRGEVVQQHARQVDASKKAGGSGRAFPYEKNDYLFLPLRLLADQQAEAGSKEWLDLYYKELKIELKAMRSMQERMSQGVQDTLKRGAGADLPTSQHLIAQWLPPLQAAIEKEQIKYLNYVRSRDSLMVGPYLLLLPAYVLANASLHGLITAVLMSDQLGLTKLVTACHIIGKNVQRQLQWDMMAAKAARVNRQRLILQQKLKERPLSAADDLEAAEGNLNLPTMSASMLHDALDFPTDGSVTVDGMTFANERLEAEELGSSNKKTSSRKKRRRTDDDSADSQSSERSWFQSWKSRLLADPEFGNLEEEELRKELLHRLKALRPYEVPDPAESDEGYPQGSSMIAASSQEGSLKLVQGNPSTLEKAMLKNSKQPDAVKLGILNAFLNKARRAGRAWQQDRSIKVGARLLQLMIQNCTIREWDETLGKFVRTPAFEHHTQATRFRRQGLLRLHDDVTRQLVKLKEVKSFLLPAYQPMVIPPLPWQRVDFGAYLVSRSYFMRHRHFKPQKQALEAADAETPGLSRVRASLTALGETSWRINKDMLKVISRAVKKDLDICGLPLAPDTPIELPVKRPRFRTMGGGYWALRKFEIAAAEEEARETQERDENDAIGLLFGEPGSHESVDESAAFPEEMANAEARMLGLKRADEGDALTLNSTLRKGAFQRTQLLATFSQAETEHEQRERRKLNSKIRKANRERYSLLCDLKLKLDNCAFVLKSASAILNLVERGLEARITLNNQNERNRCIQVAQKFKKEKAIYFPHSLDFRGRAYPMHPHLNHLGDDLCRGLLEFAEGKPLGPSGLFWLHIKLANTWGNGEDKKSFEGRQQFVLDNLDIVLESAKKPFDCTWWQGAEEPWQFLAAAQELRRALKCPNPERFLSHIPIAIDGSCNGLQHYAALARDRPGGAAVNLTAADKPQDVYSQVADIVRDRMTEEAESGTEIARILLPEVDRKLVKQTVMTSVYGVTFPGARDQISARLKERGWVNPSMLGKYDEFVASIYITKHTMKGLQQRFAQAKEVMEWLSRCAYLISHDNQLVQWTTPLGLPVVQPYTNPARKHVYTAMQRIIVSDQHNSHEKPIHKARQKTAFPPNYIHSLDSTHMLMTAAACQKAGLSFAGVHDSFWTHACDVPTLRDILREQFVELYSQPLLQNLLEEFQERYPGVKFPPHPKKGDLGIEEVLESPYFFS